MPRDGSGNYTAPAGTTAIANTVIESAKFNALVADLVADANAARPVSAGGTGRSALSADVQSLLGTANYAAMFAAIVTNGSVTKAKIENLSSYTVLGNVSGIAAAPAEVSVLDEDDMSSDSATALATQQSIAAYVTAQISAAISDLSGVPTGSRIGYTGFSAPSGWVLANGLTIGNASSNATNRANADTEDLFALLWNNYADTELPIVDSAGSASTRGASAAADYAADKAIPVPDYAGRVGTGRDNMRGSSIGRVTSSQKHGIDGNTLGKSGGASEHVLSEAELPDHVHEAQPFTNWAAGGSARFGVNSSTYNRNTGGVYLNTQGAGGDEAHTNMQPSIIETVIIKL
jgi:microcystin-dependent protein